jgi:hypothetical protein
MGYYMFANIYYGWLENEEEILDYDDLSKIYSNLEYFTTETKNNYPLDIWYGISCDLDNNSGHVIISDEDKKNVIDSYYVWCKNKNIEPNIDNIKFMVGFDCEYMYNMKVYKFSQQ